MTKRERQQSEIGDEIKCARCGEFWPADSEFFFMNKGKPHSWCKACYRSDPKIVAKKSALHSENIKTPSIRGCSMNTINKRTDRIMVDLETLGKRAGCAILSIGAVTFSAETGVVGTPFYMVVNASSCALYGLHSDPETLAWWDAQSDEAKRVLRYAEDYETSASIKFALAQFNEYVSQFDNPEIWGNGSDFDNAILIAAMAPCGIEPAWKFWNNRCFRTLKNMYPEIKMDRHGTHHNALDDATTQAKHAMAILKQAGSVAGFKEAISMWKDATPGNGESNIEAMIQRINWLENNIQRVEKLLSDDASAMSFQTLGQYRAALIKALKGGAA